MPDRIAHSVRFYEILDMLGSMVPGIMVGETKTARPAPAPKRLVGAGLNPALSNVPANARCPPGGSFTQPRPFVPLP